MKNVDFSARFSGDLEQASCGLDGGFNISPDRMEMDVGIFCGDVLAFAQAHFIFTVNDHAAMTLS
ncbi:hypothetical protein D3C87_2126630 [compost metagenome]